MNCFHFCIFELSKAFPWLKFVFSGLLWIAFIFVSLNYQKHCELPPPLIHTGCELLSFLYLWTIKSITNTHWPFRTFVVNCFHFCIFELSKALPPEERKILGKLWIAFIFVSLNYQKHLASRKRIQLCCCELLSFLYLWTIKSIWFPKIPPKSDVVNCFHFCIFELSKAFNVAREYHY